MQVVEGSQYETGYPQNRNTIVQAGHTAGVSCESVSHERFKHVSGYFDSLVESISVEIPEQITNGLEVIKKRASL